MSTSSVTANSAFTTTPAIDSPYDVSQEEVNALFAAAAAGDVVTVTVKLNEFGLSWYSYDIQRLTDLSKKYAPLETHGDALISILQTHEEGAVPANDEMLKYLDEAIEQAQKENKEIPGNVMQTIYNIKNKVEVEEEDAKRLYSWALEMKEFVIPAEYKIEKISNELNTLQDGYEEQLRKASRMADVV